MVFFALGLGALRARRAGDTARHPTPHALVGVAAAVVLLAAPSYVRCWIKYGSPVYPARVELGPWVLVDGTSRLGNLTELAERPAWERYWRYWTEFRAPLLPGSRGGFGPLFPFVLLPCMCLCTLAALWKRAGRWLFLAASFWMVLLLPAFNVPRYCLYILLTGAVCTVFCVQALPRTPWQRIAAPVLLALQLWNQGQFSTGMYDRLGWQWHDPRSSLGFQRNRSVRDGAARYGELGPSPATRSKLYELMRPGELVISAVHEFTALLYDPEFTYRVEFRPAEPGVEHRSLFEVRVAPEYVRAWVAGLQRDHAAAVLVYAGSCEAEALDRADSGYRLAYAQPADQGRYPVHIYRAAEP